jgi:hypothetical protein
MNRVSTTRESVFTPTILNRSFTCALEASAMPLTSERVTSSVLPTIPSGSVARVSPSSIPWKSPGARILNQTLERHLSFTERAGWAFFFSALGASGGTMVLEGGPRRAKSPT